MSADQPAEEQLRMFAAPSAGDKGNDTIRLGLISVGCWKLDDVRSASRDSVVIPQTKSEFRDLAALLNDHRKAPLRGRPLRHGLTGPIR